MLRDLLANAADTIRLSSVLDAPTQDLIAAVRDQGLDGIIAKRSGSRYESGEATGAWVTYRVLAAS